MLFFLCVLVFFFLVLGLPLIEEFCSRGDEVQVVVLASMILDFAAFGISVIVFQIVAVLANQGLAIPLDNKVGLGAMRYLNLRGGGGFIVFD